MAETQVLARKWRPRSFAELVGQEHVVRALGNALDTGRLHHAYLFTGTRGVGKTTVARILAKALNCERGVSARPCGQCQPCREIDSGRFVDLLEVDAATNTRVEEMRELLDRAQYMPVAGRFKVYIIDEVHMLSRSAFNSMLKTLEEPPDHVKFILATTDPQKVPVTVLSRCLQFNLKQMPADATAGHLARVLEQEGLGFEGPALAAIARAAHGSMRDALSLLDQAIAYGAGRIETAQVADMLGSIEQDHLFDLLDALAAEDGSALMAVADRMAQQSLSFDAGLQDLAALLHQIALVQAVSDALPPDASGRDRILALAARLDAESVQLYYQIVLHGRRDLSLAPDEYAGFTMTLLRMLAFTPQIPGAAVRPAAGREDPAVTESRAATPARAAAQAAAAVRPSPGPAQQQPRPTAQPRPVVPAASTRTAPVTDAPAPAAAPAPPSATAAPARLAGPDDADGPAVEFDGDWHALVARLSATGVAAQLAKNCEFRQHDGNHFVLDLPEPQKQLMPYKDKLRAALEGLFGGPVRLTIAVGAATGRSVAAEEQRVQQQKQEAAVEAIRRDPFVREMVDQFGARVIESTIKPNG